MSDKYPTDQLDGVPETMLIPLYARAVETARPDAIIQDPHAVAMMARIDYDFSKFDDAPLSALGVAIRTEILDDWTRHYLAAHPDAVVVNLGAGLDTRFFRVDDGRVRWYELDLPQSIALRRRFLQDSPRHTMLAASALDFGWMDHIEARPHTLIIAEGLLMYFDEADVRRLLLALAERFRGGDAFIEVVGASQAAKNRSDAVAKTSAHFRWGIRHAADIADWDPRLHYVNDVSIYDRHEARWLSLDVAWPAPLSALRNTVDRIVHLQFAP